jgi:hypothetical protein
MFPGKIIEIAGPVVTDTNGLKMLGAVPGPNPNRSESGGLRKATGGLVITPRRTDTSGPRAARTPAGSPRLTDTERAKGVPRVLGLSTFTWASPNRAGWATLVARTRTDRLALPGTAAGAVYKPAAEMVPNVLFPPLIPLTAQITL